MTFRFSITTKQLAYLAFVFYFSNALLRTVVNRIVPATSLSVLFVAIAIYAPLLISTALKPQKYLKVDFLFLFIFLVLFFLITLAIHPEYEFFYRRESYGVWDHVFVPYRGIYAYLFVRLFDDPKEIKKLMKISGWIMLPYFTLRIINSGGSWTGVAGNNMREMSYSVSFGYEALLFMLFFLYDAISERKSKDIIVTILYIIMILTAGSRGPFLCIGIFIVLYILVAVKNSRHKIAIIVSVSAVTAIVYSSYSRILYTIMLLLQKVGVSSRFVTTMLEGTIADDSGRSRIWDAAIQMIKDNPFGYGAMGSHHVIYRIIYAGYPHNLFLEIFIDFGLIIGSIIIIVLFWNLFSILLKDKYKEWVCVMLPFLGAACSLLISLTFWSVPAFWAAIGVGFNCKLRCRNRKERSFKGEKTRISIAKVR